MQLRPKNQNVFPRLFSRYLALVPGLFIGALHNFCIRVNVRRLFVNARNPAEE